MDKYTRREFIQSSAAALPILSGASVVQANSPKASDVIELGRSRLPVSRLGFGAGDGRGKVFLEMGQNNFTRLIRYAYDRGIRFFDLDPSHIHEMMAKALHGVERSSYTLITGTSHRPHDELPGLIDRFRKELDTDYIDGVLITAISAGNWAEEFGPYRDILSQAKADGRIKAHGVSVHGMDALLTLEHDPWVEFALISFNHKGVYMDSPLGVEWTLEQQRDESLPVIQRIHAAGIGVTSMKTFGANGFDNSEERRECIRFILRQGCVDSMPIRFKRTDHLDEVIAMIEEGA